VVRSSLGWPPVRREATGKARKLKRRIRRRKASAPGPVAAAVGALARALRKMELRPVRGSAKLQIGAAELDAIAGGRMLGGR
jgi:hypothetical protein